MAVTIVDAPAQVQASSRFRPASELDFKRYAKCVADLLESPLQEAQELLARIYGYEHLHELQQAFKMPGEPGPFEDRMDDAGSSLSHLAYGIRIRRHDRLAQCYWAWVQQKPYASRRDDDDELLLWDLGLFLSPPKQRIAARDVERYRKTRTGFSWDGYPFGFNGTLHLRYLCSWPLDEDAFKQARTELPFPDTFILHRYIEPRKT